MAYDLYPAIDDGVPIRRPRFRQALSISMELRNGVTPMTTATRNNLLPIEKWDGRLIANTTTDHLERYDAGGASWDQIASTIDLTNGLAAKVSRAAGTMTADPTVALGVATKQYVDTYPEQCGSNHRWPLGVRPLIMG